MAKRTIAPEPRSAQEKSFPTRKLKVRKCFYDYQLLRAYPPPSVPWINIRGYWLNKVGFTINTPVCVEVSDGCLVIRVIRSTS
ncbi:MAG: SymE family type I addiction module toxin [Pseudomonadota bacterium]